MSGISKERVLAALNHDHADRVPTFEWLIDKKIIEALYPGADYFEFCSKFQDGIIVDINYDHEDLGGGRTKNEWGIIQEATGEAHAYPIDGPIHNREEFEAYTPPAPNKEGRYQQLEDTLAKFGDDKAVILHLNDIWSLPSRMMPFEEYIMMVLDDPDLILDILKMTVDAQIKLAEGAAKRGCQFVFTGDDVAYNSGPMISPAMFREMFFPELKRIFGAYKDLGFYILKHSDGNMMSLMDMYVEAQIDLFDPIDPLAGMDIAYMKEHYGKKIALKGNVNCATTLVSGTIEETIAETKKCLEIGMPGGGYVCSSSNSIHSSINPANFKAMLDTIEVFGTY
ncbi:uroporphyrinogen III decarboxylase [Clostridia bacterium]|nr:uroporphyrinogen III decarboxylase [Clostridia bacterium]